MITNKFDLLMLKKKVFQTFFFTLSILFIIGISIINNFENVKADNTPDRNQLFGNIWNPVVGYISLDGADGTSASVQVDKFPDSSIPNRVVHRLYGFAWNPTTGYLNMGSDGSSLSVYLEKSPATGSSGSYYLCGSLWSPVVGYIEIGNYNYNTNTCDYLSVPNKNVVANIKTDGIVGTLWNPVLGWLGLGTENGGNVFGFDMTGPTITILTDMNSEDFLYMSRKGNKTNSLSFKADEYVTYKAEIRNETSGIKVKEFEGALSDLMNGFGPSTTETWDGNIDFLEPDLEYITNLVNKNSGQMYPSTGINWKILEPYEKELTPLFNIDSSGETAFDFDGTNFLQATNASSFAISNSGITIKAWLKPEYNATGNLPIVSKEDGTNYGNYTLFIENANTDSKLTFKYKDTNNQIKTCSTPSNSIPKDRWSFVAVAHNFGSNYNNSSSLYINDQKYPCTLNNVNPNTNGNIYIGYSPSVNNKFRGYIASVAIFNQKKTDEEIMTSYNKIPTSFEVGAIGYWQLYNSMLAPDGYYRWHIQAWDKALNESMPNIPGFTMSLRFTVDNTPPDITNIQLKYEVEEHFRRDSLGNIITHNGQSVINGGLPTLFTEKVVAERDLDTDSYIISRDLSKDPTIDLSFNLDGITDYKSIQVIPYVEAYGPYPNSTDLAYNSQNLTKQINNVAIFSDLESEYAQLQHMTILVRDKAMNESQRTIEIINNQPKLSVSKVVNITGTEPPIDKLAESSTNWPKVHCDKVKQTPPYCDLIENVLTVSNIATKNDALIRDQNKIIDPEIQYGELDTDGPIIVINDLEKEELEDHQWTFSKVKPFFFNTQNTRDRSAVLSYYWEVKKDDAFMEASFAKHFSYTFDSLTSEYSLYLKVTDTYGNFSEFNIDPSNITVIPKDEEDPYAKLEEDNQWPVNVPYFFDATQSRDNVQIAMNAYKWDFNDKDDVDFEDPDFVGKRAVNTFTVTGDYLVTLQVTDTTGNTATTTMNITIKDEDSFTDELWNPVIGFSDTNSSFPLNGIQFNGQTSFIKFNADKLNSETAGTVEFWFKPNEETTSTETMLSLGSGLSTQDSSLYINYTEDHKVEIVFTKTGAGQINAVTVDQIEDSKWNHLALTFSSAGNALYINGQEMNLSYTTGNKTTSMLYSDLALKKGVLGAKMNTQNLTNSFAGAIDEFKMWSVNRPAEAIYKSVYQKYSGNENFLTYYFDFENIDEYDTSKSLALNGNISKGVILDNNKFVKTTDDELHIGLWVKFDSNASGKQPLIGRNMDDSYGNYSLYADLTDDNNNLVFSYMDNSDSLETCPTTNKVFSKNTWHYIAFNHKFGTNTQTKFFVDGNIYPCSFGALIDPPKENTNYKINIGYHKLGTAKFMQGNIDSLSIWSKTRTLPEIMNDMAGNIIGIEPDLIGYYRFEEGIEDSVQNEASVDYGQMSLTYPIWSDDIPTGEIIEKRTKLEEMTTGANLRQTDYIGINASSLTITTNSFTVETWIRIPQDAPIRNIISKKVSLNNEIDDAGFAIYKDPSRNALVFHLEDTGRHKTEVISNTKLSELTKDNKWHHIAFTANRSLSTYNIYIDGKLDSSSVDTTLTQSLSNNSGFVIGSSIHNHATNITYTGFTGDLTEFRVWDYARPSTEISRDMNKRISNDHGSYDRLVAYFKFNEIGKSNTNKKIRDYSKKNVKFTSSTQLYEFLPPNDYDSSPAMEPQNDLWWRPKNPKEEKVALFAADNSYITISDGYSLLKANQNFTIEFWVNPTTLINTPYIMSNNILNSFYIAINPNGSLEVQLDSNSKLTTDPNLISLDTWTHVAFVLKNNADDEILINGASVKKGELDTTNSNSLDLIIGKNSTDTNYLKGYLSDLRIWNTERNISEILEFINKRVDRSNDKYSDLLAYYYLNDGDTFTRDSSENSTLHTGNNTNLLFSTHSPKLDDKFKDITSDEGHETIISLKGVDSISTTNSMVGDFDKESFTIDLWARPNAISSSSMTILKKIDANNIGYKLTMNTQGKLVLDIKDSYLKTYTINTKRKINDSKWHHISFSVDYENSQILIFVDGEKQNIDNYQFFEMSSIKNSSPFVISGYTGDLDGVRISSTIRYKEDFYPYKKIQNDSRTKGLYNFDEGEGQKITDSSPYQYDLDISTSSAWRQSVTPDYSMTCITTCLAKINSDLGVDTSSFTFEFYAKVSDDQGTLYHYEDNGDKIIISYYANAVSVVLMPSGSTYLLPNPTITSINYPINDNVWHHIALSVDRNSATNNVNAYFFIDGVLMASQRTVSSKSFSDLNEQYFATNNNNSNPIYGQMDMIRQSVGVARYTSNFKPDPFYKLDSYTKTFFSFNDGPKSNTTVQNDAGTSYDISITNMNFTNLNTYVSLYSTEQVSEESGHFLGVYPGTNKLRGKVWNPATGWMDFDASESNGFQQNSTLEKESPIIKDYDPENSNHVYKLEGSFFSPTLGYHKLDTDLYPLTVDTRTGIVLSGGSWNPVIGFLDWAGKYIPGLDLSAPILEIDPLHSSFLKSDTTSITMTGRTTDRFGTGVRAVYYKLNDAGWRLAIDDSPNNTFSNFHAVIKGLRLGENEITFKAIDKNGNIDKEAQVVTVYRAYAMTIDFFSPFKVSKVSFKGDSSLGIERVPSEIRIVLSNNANFVNNSVDKLTWEVVHVRGNRTDEEHVYTIDDFDSDSGYSTHPSNAEVKYARLIVEDTVGHSAPLMDKEKGFKVYTEMDNTMTDPWSVTDTFKGNQDGVEFYWNEIVPEPLTGRTDINPLFTQAWTYLPSKPQLDLQYPPELTNVVIDANNEDVKFRFSPGYDRRLLNTFLVPFDSRIPANDSVVVEFQTIATK